MRVVSLKETNNNVLTDEHIAEIVKLFADKADVIHIAKSKSYEDIKKKDYDLSVRTHVQPKDTRELIDIVVLNQKIRETVSKIDRLRAEIEEIVAEIEGSSFN